MQPPTRCKNCGIIIEGIEEFCENCHPACEDEENPYEDDVPPFWQAVPLDRR